MKNLNTMTEAEKKAHLAKIAAKLKGNVKFQIIDVTPKGYGPEKVND
ncbi:MAG: hypothetical protein ACK53T_01175 [Planctomycetota bacterium]|jgi:hypothetical protein